MLRAVGRTEKSGLEMLLECGRDWRAESETEECARALREALAESRTGEIGVALG